MVTSRLLLNSRRASETKFPERPSRPQDALVNPQIMRDPSTVTGTVRNCRHDGGMGMIEKTNRPSC